MTTSLKTLLLKFISTGGKMKFPEISLEIERIVPLQVRDSHLNYIELPLLEKRISKLVNDYNVNHTLSLKRWKFIVNINQNTGKSYFDIVCTKYK